MVAEPAEAPTCFFAGFDRLNLRKKRLNLWKAAGSFGGYFMFFFCQFGYYAYCCTSQKNQQTQIVRKKSWKIKAK